MPWRRNVRREKIRWDVDEPMSMPTELRVILSERHIGWSSSIGHVVFFAKLVFMSFV